ncbi:Bug family tripartite tricarboxylate transporter substrate binding protein [Cupriavidus sp. 2TAF22]|uniref:Bug family tripartite tricarboxylate transporter substrate binding protein n=1 Tax=unclassified Cupriavidus TaxID=2640874 RepID=UPI003F901629
MKHAISWVAALVTSFATVPLLAQPVPAQADAGYPSKPIQLVVAYPPGGGTDILARVVGAELQKALGQPVVVVNRGGASGAIGTEFAARAAPDGYTLLLATANVTISPAVDARTRFNPTRDFVPVTLLSDSPFVLVSNASFAPKTIAELLAYSKAHPGAVNYASTGVGSPQQLATELLKKKAGLDWTHVPYQGGGPAMADLMAGQVQVMFSNVLPVLPYIRSGKVRALAVTTQEPLPALSKVPTMIQEGQQDFVVSFWSGVMAPAGTPGAIVAKLNDALLKIMQLPAVRERLAREGSIVTPMTSAKFAEFIAEDAARWRQVAQVTGVRAER